MRRSTVYGWVAGATGTISSAYGLLDPADAVYAAPHPSFGRWEPCHSVLR